MLDWLLGGGFVPRDACGPWTADLRTLNQIANALIALAYFSIPASLLWLWRRGKAHLPRPGMLPCFAAFILLCGLTHVCDVVAFWAAPYRLFTLVTTMTAAISVVTACLLPGAVKYLASLPSPGDMRRTIADMEATRAIAEGLLAAQSTHARNLSREADVLRRQFEDLKYQVVTEDRYQELRRQLHNLRGA